MIDTAREAGAVIREYRGRAGISAKASNNLVTEADTAAEKLIISSLTSVCPKAAILAEETHADTPLPEGELWIIDPLDGTNNFAHNIPLYSVSIGYALDGRMEKGVVYDVCHDELFWAVRGKGVFLDNEQVFCSGHESLDQSIIATGFYYDRGALVGKTLNSLQCLFNRNIRGVRRTGSAALDLCWIACGRFDAFFEYELSPWDYAAGTLCVTEAGGKVCGRTGESLTLSSRSVLAAAPNLFDTFVSLVSWR